MNFEIFRFNYAVITFSYPYGGETKKIGSEKFKALRSRFEAKGSSLQEKGQKQSQDDKAPRVGKLSADRFSIFGTPTMSQSSSPPEQAEPKIEAQPEVAQPQLTTNTPSSSHPAAPPPPSAAPPVAPPTAAVSTTPVSEAASAASAAPAVVAPVTSPSTDQAPDSGSPTTAVSSHHTATVPVPDSDAHTVYQTIQSDRTKNPQKEFYATVPSEPVVEPDIGTGTVDNQVDDTPQQQQAGGEPQAEQVAELAEQVLQEAAPPGSSFS